ncbi:hypothetical protein NDU88_004432 [Pleurodeles waltl]|uniref:Uncharacterized protein n=1 Tax=Pleurodeles waltl TaxID=8319 RepID=A0AAV7RJ59_PLEWA|nr:hypothetical protein NDU88_004432 [Pleurodeles waltl]
MEPWELVGSLLHCAPLNNITAAAREAGRTLAHRIGCRRLYPPSSSSSALVFQVEHDVDEHQEDLQFRFHGGVVLPCVSDGESLLFCDVFPPGF